MTHQAPVVLVVDAVPQYLGTTGDEQAASAQVIARARFVVEEARKAGIPVLHSVLRFRADGLDGGHYLRKNPELSMFAGRTVASVAGLAPEGSELTVSRTYPSPFFATSLAATVRGIDADSVIIVGAKTSEGVRAAAMDAMQHGFAVIVVGDAVHDDASAHHDMALVEMARYAEVHDADEVGALMRAIDTSRYVGTEVAPWN